MELLLLFALTVTVFGKDDLLRQSDVTDKQPIIGVSGEQMRRLCERKIENLGEPLVGCTKDVPPEFLRVVINCAGGRNLQEPLVVVQALKDICKKDRPENDINELIGCCKKTVNGNQDLRAKIVFTFERLRTAMECVEDVLWINL